MLNYAQWTSLRRQPVRSLLRFPSILRCSAPLR
jgi:hypothetical protein